MLYLTISLVSLVLVLLIYNFKKKLYFLNESPKKDLRKLHGKDVTRVGGIIFFSNLIIYLYTTDIYLQSILLFGFFILILGLSEDIVKNISKYFRLLILFSLCTIFIDINDFVIIDFDNYFLNYFFGTYTTLSLFFSIFGLIILINGFNFIDGLNGLLLGIAILILITFTIYSLNNPSGISSIFIAILIPIIILFFINLFGGVVLAGDGGSYFLGFIIGAISILVSNYGVLSSFEIACIIFYPVMEFVCSVMRRLISFSNPLKPDGLHLHQLLFRIVFHKLKNKSPFFTVKNINSLSSLVIIISIALLIIAHYHFKTVIGDTVIFTLFCLLYLLVYNILISISYKNNLLIEEFSE